MSYLSDRILHDEDVSDAAKLSKVLPQLLRRGLPREPAHEELPGGRVRGRGAATRGPVLAPGLIAGAVAVDAVHTVHVNSAMRRRKKVELFCPCLEGS